MKILCIGNSFSANACVYMTQIAKAGGLDLTTVNLFIGGCSLERHCSNIGMNDREHIYTKQIDGVKVGTVSLDEALAEDAYDVVSLQQASHLSGIPETYDPYLTTLVEHVRKYQPNARLAIHETWAYETDYKNSSFKNDFNNNRIAMHEALKECYHRAAELIGADIFIPAGEVIHALRSQKDFDPELFGTKLSSDGAHLGAYGKYAAGLTWCCVLGMENVEDNTFVPDYLGIMPRKLSIIKKTVKKIVLGEE